MKKIALIQAVVGIFVLSASGHGFLNLNFESAQNLPGNPGPDGTSLSITNALPYWSAYSGNLALSYIYFVSNNFPGVSTTVELESGSLALSGNNLTVELFGDGSISQTGMVPGDTESLQFEAYALSGSSGFSVSLGGQALSYSEVSQGLGYNVYGANIPAGMAGQAGRRP